MVGLWYIFLNVNTEHHSEICALSAVTRTLFPERVMVFPRVIFDALKATHPIPFSCIAFG